MATTSEGTLYQQQQKAPFTFMGGIPNPSPDLGPGRYTINGSITNAQALTLNSAPVDAIPAIPGKIIIPAFIAWRVNYVAAYSANANVSLRFAGVAVDITTPLGVIFNALPHVDQILWSDMIQSINPFGTGVDLRNTRVQIFASADVTTGDPGNLLNYFIEYRVIDRP